MNRFKNILYVLNEPIGEPSASLIRAVSLAKNNQADLTLLYVLPKLSLSSYSKQAGISGQELQSRILAHEQAALDRLLSLLDQNLTIQTRIQVGKRYLESIRAVQAKNFDLVVKEADAVDWLDRFFGSDDMHLLRKCPCPVWLMKKDEKADYKHIMAAVDFDTGDEDSGNDELNSVIMDLASSLALADFTSLDVVNAYDVPEAGFVSLWTDQPDKVERELLASEYSLRARTMDELLEELKHKLGTESYNYLSLRSHLVQGVPGREIPKMAKKVKADLVVMGTVARTGISGIIIGNTAELILSQLRCSVLAIKPRGFVSPVS
ncbi:MAG: universal stress protein [Marinobacter sp.]|nr:universal stress protein [Marinobacter sp.]